MKHTRPITLQDRLSAMFRVLSGVTAAAVVFSYVFFSPLIDMKDTIAASAESRSNWSRDNWPSRDNWGSRGDWGDRGVHGNRSRNKERSNRGKRSRESFGNRPGRSSPDTGRSNTGGSDTGKSNSSGSKSSNSPASGGGDSSSQKSSSAPSSSSSPASGNKPAPVARASQKPGSGSLIESIFGNKRFAGDSEPSGNALSAREEREAIQNGWQ